MRAGLASEKLASGSGGTIPEVTASPGQSIARAKLAPPAGTWGGWARTGHVHGLGHGHGAFSVTVSDTDSVTDTVST